MHRRAAALLPVLGLVTVVALPIAWRILNPTSLVAAPVATALNPSATFTFEGAAGSSLEVALMRAGVPHEALAAVGASGHGLSGLVHAASTHFANGATTLGVADAAYATAKRESDRLRRLIESGKGSQADVANYQAQMTALATATAQQGSALSALFAAATASLTANQRTSLNRIHAARTWGLPTEFLVVERSPSAWVELRSALANERFAAKYGEEPDLAAQAFLAQARADAAVAAAHTGIETNGAGVTASWDLLLED